MTLDEIEAFLTSDTPDVDDDGIVIETVEDVVAARQTHRDYLAARDDTTYVRTYAYDNGDVLATAETIVIDADFDAHPALPEAMASGAYDDALQRLRDPAGRPTLVGAPGRHVPRSCAGGSTRAGATAQPGKPAARELAPRVQVFAH